MEMERPIDTEVSKACIITAYNGTFETSFKQHSIHKITAKLFCVFVI